MSQSMLLPGFAALFGVVAAMFLLGFRAAPARASAPAPELPDDDIADDDIADDDEYFEYTVAWDDAPVTEPIAAAAPPPPEAEDPWRRVLDELLPEPPPRRDPEPIAFTRNGFELESEEPRSTGRHSRP
jgi:hypothetical protein